MGNFQARFDRRNGFSLVETTVGIALASGVMFAIAQGYASISRDRRATDDQATLMSLVSPLLTVMNDPVKCRAAFHDASGSKLVYAPVGDVVPIASIGHSTGPGVRTSLVEADRLPNHTLQMRLRSLGITPERVRYGGAVLERHVAMLEVEATPAALGLKWSLPVRILTQPNAPKTIETCGLEGLADTELPGACALVDGQFQTVSATDPNAGNCKPKDLGFSGFFVTSHPGGCRTPNPTTGSCSCPATAVEHTMDKSCEGGCSSGDWMKIHYCMGGT